MHQIWVWGKLTLCTRSFSIISQFSEDQKKAWELLQTDHNIFLTGEAGSGKSYLIREFIKNKSPKTFPVLASTGAAAVLIGGRTFHSFMGLGIIEGGVQATIKRVTQDKKVLKRIKKIQGFIVDEISMLSAETLNVAEAICKAAKKSDLPWGGLRVIAVGDFAQLPPIDKNSKHRPWAFLSHSWQKTGFVNILLKQNMRSENGSFLKILNQVRNGQVCSQVSSFLNDKSKDVSDQFEGTRLFPLRKQTDKYNNKQLSELPGDLKCFPATYSGQERFIKQLKKRAPVPEQLFIKLEALVMLRQNDHQGRWVNGSTGYIKKISNESISIELLNGHWIKIEPVSFSMLNAEGLSVATVTNFPLNLAYAATIHKSQGMTLDRLMVNLNSLWEPGQAYVALSRITHPEHLRIEAWQPQSIKADPLVQNFYQELEQPLNSSSTTESLTD